MNNKGVVSFLLFLLITTIAAAQTLPATELIRKSKCTDVSCFNTIMVAAGFHSPEIAQVGNLNMFFYSSNKFFVADSSKNISKPNTCSFVVSKDKNYSAASLTVISKSNYLSLSSAFINLGFTKNKTYTKDDDIATDYSSDNYPGYTLTIHIINRQENSSAWTEYQFEVKHVS